MRSATALKHRVRPGSERAKRRIFAAGAQDWSYRDGPGAGRSAVPAMKRSRRAADPSQFKRGRPSSVSLSLAAIGDKWTVLVMREAFLGVRRFDRLLSELMIAPNFLADPQDGRRLQHAIPPQVRSAGLRSRSQPLPGCPGPHLMAARPSKSSLQRDSEGITSP